MLVILLFDSKKPSIFCYLNNGSMRNSFKLSKVTWKLLTSNNAASRPTEMGNIQFSIYISPTAVFYNHNDERAYGHVRDYILLCLRTTWYSHAYIHIWKTSCGNKHACSYTCHAYWYISAIEE